MADEWDKYKVSTNTGGDKWDKYKTTSADWASAARDFRGNATPTHGAPVRMDNTPPSLRKMTKDDKANAAMEFLRMTGLGSIGNGVNRIAHSGESQAPPQTPYQNYLGQPPTDQTRRSQFDEVVGGLADMGEGGLKLASPLLAGASAGPLIEQGAVALATGPWGAARLLGEVTGGAVGAGVGAVGGRAVAGALGAGPGVVQGAEDLGGLAGAVVGGVIGNKAVGKVKDWVVGDPVKNTIQALKPSNKKINFEENIQTGNPIIKAQEATLGKKISTVEDYIDAAELAKKQLGDNIEKALGPGRLTQATIDGSKIADAAMDAIPQTVRNENPELVARINRSLDAYRRPITLEESDGLRIEWNAQLASEYSKFPNAQNAAKIAEPSVATRNAMVTTLRKLADEKVEQLLPGSQYANIRREYGAVTDLQDSAFRRLMVSNRQADLSLHERFGWAKALGRSGVNLVTGNPTGAVADLMEAGASTALKEAATSNSKIANAMKVTTPAKPRVVPSAPRPVALLEAGPVRTTPPVDASGPSRTPPQEVIDLILNGRMTPDGKWVTPPSRQIPAGTSPIGVSGTIVPDIRGNIINAVKKETSGPRLLPPPSGPPMRGLSPFSPELGSQHGDILGGVNPPAPPYTQAQLLELMRRLRGNSQPLR